MRVVATVAWPGHSCTLAMVAPLTSALVAAVARKLSEVERQVYEAAWRQCGRCEAPAREFRAASDEDLARATGHLVTPVVVGPEMGTQ